MNIYISIGLGNPGMEYNKNRHNFGHMAIDYIAKREKKKYFNTRYFAYFHTQKYKDKDLYFFKTKTYMNNSGMAVSRISEFTSIKPKNMVIIYDDIDLPLGTIRIRKSGSSGGHKGMESIIEKLGTENIPRIRLGIGPQPVGIPSEVFVLENFREDELIIVKEVFNKLYSAIMDISEKGIDFAMSKYNTTVLEKTDNLKKEVSNG